MSKRTQMIHIVTVLVLVAALVPTLSVAADTCAPGERRLNNGEPCIPETLFNYLYCLSKSGGGKIEVASKGDSSTTTGLEVTVGGKGSGVILKGEGNAGFKQTEANRVAKEISERIDPSLAARCQTLSGPATEPASPIKTPTNNAAQASSGLTDGCMSPYVWRLAVPSDHVCVNPESRKRVELENQRAAERREASGGNYGADTCKMGYVWREAFEGDSVCVTPDRREEVKNENAFSNQHIQH
ncbi:MAG: hypothetical protein WC782_14790 [Methylococcaceae bacterium]|jgi:hypothetical protein